jgi:hypothetical protein
MDPVSRLTELVGYPSYENETVRLWHAQISRERERERFEILMPLIQVRLGVFLRHAEDRGFSLKTEASSLTDFGTFLSLTFGREFWDFDSMDDSIRSFIVDASLFLGETVRAEIPSARWELAPQGAIGEGQHSITGFSRDPDDFFSPLWVVISFLKRVARGGERTPIEIPQGKLYVTVPTANVDDFSKKIQILIKKSIGADE